MRNNTPSNNTAFLGSFAGSPLGGHGGRRTRRRGHELVDARKRPPLAPRRPPLTTTTTTTTTTTASLLVGSSASSSSSSSGNNNRARGTGTSTAAAATDNNQDNKSKSKNKNTGAREPPRQHTLQQPDWPALAREGRALVSGAVADARREHKPLGDALRAAAEKERTNPFVWYAAAMHHARCNRRGPARRPPSAPRRDDPPLAANAPQQMTTTTRGVDRDASIAGEDENAKHDDDDDDDDDGAIMANTSNVHGDKDGDDNDDNDDSDDDAHSLATDGDDPDENPLSSPFIPTTMHAMHDLSAGGNNDDPPGHGSSSHESPATNVEAANDVIEAALKAVPHGLRAALFLAKGNLAPSGSDDAIAAYRAGIADDEHHVPLFAALATELTRQNRLQEARSVFRDAAGKFPDRAHVAVLKAWAAFEHSVDNHEESRRLWRMVTQLHPRDAKAWRRYADAELKLGAQPVVLVDILEQAVSIHPANSELRIALSRSVERLRGVAAARECLEHPAVRDDQFALRALATLEFREQNFDRARQTFRRAADMEANFHRPRAVEGGDYRMGQSDPSVPAQVEPAYARSELEPVSMHNASSIEPEFKLSEGGLRLDVVRGVNRRGSTVKSLHAWALMESKLGKPDVARSLLMEAQAISPDDPAVWRALAELESRAKNFEMSRITFQRAVATGGADSRLWLAWGKTENLAGNFEKATELLQMAVRKNSQGNKMKASPQNGKRPDEAIELPRLQTPSNSRLRGSSSSPSKHFAPFKFEDGDFASLKGASRGASSARNLADALRELSNISSQNGDLEMAVRYLEQATEVDPSYEPAWRHLAELVRRRHGIEAVRDMYSKALGETERHVHAKLKHWWALEERSAGFTDNARELLRRATCAEPKYMSAWLSWALLEKTEGAADRACELFQEAALLATRSSLRAPFLFQTWGRVEESIRRDVSRARSVYKQGHELVPDSGLILQAWAALEERCGQLDFARELLSKATIAEPQHGFIWQSWALMEGRRRRYGEAVHLFKRGLENDPSNAALLASWAMIEGRDLGNVEKGRELFARSIRIDPNYASAWHSWASMEILFGNPERARELYSRAAKIAPDDPVNWHALGSLEFEHGSSLTLPVTYFRRAIEADPTHEISYQAWALFVERKLHDLDESRRLLQMGIDKCSANGQGVMYHAWATLEQRNGNAARAREIFQKGLEVDRRKVELWLSWALLEKSLGNHKIARRLFQDSVHDILPVRDVAAIYAAWGSMEAEHGDWDEARSLFNEGIKHNPNHVPCWRAYASMEERLGNTAKASELRLASSGLRKEDVRD